MARTRGIVGSGHRRGANAGRAGNGATQTAASADQGHGRGRGIECEGICTHSWIMGTGRARGGGGVQRRNHVQWAQHRQWWRRRNREKTAGQVWQRTRATSGTQGMTAIWAGPSAAQRHRATYWFSGRGWGSPSAATVSEGARTCVPCNSAPPAPRYWLLCVRRYQTAVQ